MRIIAFVFACCLIAAPLISQTYYVAPAPAGNNANSGLSGAPWETLQYAVNRLTAGDVLIVEDGTYTGFYMDRIKGTASQRITIMARNRLGAVINAPPPGRTRNCEFLSCSYITFDGFEVTLAPAGGIVFRTFEYEYTGVNSRDNIVQYCHSHHNSVGNPAASHDGIFTGFALNFTAQYNIVHDNGEHGIYISNSADNPVVRGNVIYGNFNNGLHMNSDLSAGGDGIITGWLVEDNIIYDNGRTGINIDGGSNGVCRNNLLYNNRAGIALYQIDGAQGASDNLIVNNTIYNFLAPTTPNTGSLRAAINVMDGSNNNTIFNNIIYAVGPTGATAAFNVGVVTGLRHDYNIVGRFGNSTPAYGGTVASANETSPNPSLIFADIAGADFRLLAGCGAVDTGTGSFAGFAAPLNDITAAVRPQGSGFDIGCYERQVSGSPTFTRTVANTSTMTATRTPTPWHSATITASATQTRTVTPAYSVTFTPTVTVTATQTSTRTVTPYFSPTVTATTMATAEAPGIGAVIVFPNPVYAGRDITVAYSISGAADTAAVEIYTIGLRKIIEEKSHSPYSGTITIGRERLSGLASGMYLYRLRVEAGVKKTQSPAGVLLIINGRN